MNRPAWSSLGVLGWARAYRRDDLRPDVVAGLTTAVILIPQAMGYAMLAGLPPVVGLYAAMASTVVYALLGGSRQLGIGPVAMDSILVAAALGAVAPVTAGAPHNASTYLLYATLLALLVGGIQLLLGVLRAGFVINLLSRPVVTGFTAGAAVLIASSQLPHLFGVTLPPSERGWRAFLATWQLRHAWHLPTLALGGASVALLLVSKHRWPRFPAALFVVALGVGLSVVFALDASGVSTVGPVSGGLPRLTWPTLDTTTLQSARTLAPSAVTLALVGFLEAISIGRILARRHRHGISPNQELVALGLSNLASGVAGGYPVSGSLSRSAVNDSAGGRTQLSGLVTAAAVVLALLYLTPALRPLPHVALSAIILTAVAGLFDARGLARLWRVQRSDFFLALLTLAATVLLGIQYGVLVGVGASLAVFLAGTMRPHFALLGRVPGKETFMNMRRHPHVQAHKGVLILRIDAQFFFGNTRFLKETIATLTARDHAHTGDIRALVLEAVGVNQLDSSAADALEELDHDLQAQGVLLVLTRVKGPVRDILHRTGWLHTLAREGRIYMSTHHAVDALERHLVTGAPLADLCAHPDDNDPRAHPDRIGCGDAPS